LKLERSSRYLCSEVFITFISNQHDDGADLILAPLVVPTPAGLQLFELLKGAAPALVNPGMTAVWEMRLDEVVTGRVHSKGVIDEIAAEAGKLIAVLRRHTGAVVDLSRPAPIATRRRRGRARTKRNADKAETDTSGSTRPKAKSLRSRKAKASTPA